MPRFVLLFAVSILATMWALGFGVMAARRKSMAGRILCGAWALIAVLFAAACWYLLAIQW